MAQESSSTLREIFAEATAKRRKLNNYASASDAAYQDTVTSAISDLEQCRKLADSVSLFSPNETLEDVASGDVQYLLIDFYVGDLTIKQVGGNRKAVLRATQDAYNRYLQRLDTYAILSKDDTKLYEAFGEDRDGFAVVQTKDPAARREQKIKRYREEKELKVKLEHLRQNPHALDQDEAALRELWLNEIRLATHSTFQALDGIGEEVRILTLKPPTPPPQASADASTDQRERNGHHDATYSERLDPPIGDLLSKGKAGPILDKDGRPLRPFTLLDSRQRLRDGVFQPDHALPTMTIDEYLDEERRRGGIIEGGGDQPAAQPDEDDIARADAETMKAREWDEFVEANPKGGGNKLNRG